MNKFWPTLHRDVGLDHGVPSFGNGLNPSYYLPKPGEAGAEPVNYHVARASDRLQGSTERTGDTQVQPVLPNGHHGHIETDRGHQPSPRPLSTSQHSSPGYSALVGEAVKPELSVKESEISSHTMSEKNAMDNDSCIDEGENDSENEMEKEDAYSEVDPIKEDDMGDVDAISDRTEERPETKPKIVDLKSSGEAADSKAHIGVPNLGDFVKVETSEIFFCRLCANPSSSGVNIFEPDGQDVNLCEKISKCLPIYIAEDDPLPKMICYPCLEKVEFCFSFTDQIYQAHRQLVQQLDICDVKDKNFDYVIGTFFVDANFYAGLRSPVKEEDIQSKQDDDGDDEPERPKGKRGRKGKASKMAGSRKPRKDRSKMRLKMRFAPSLTTCAHCGLKSDSSKENLEHWTEAHKDVGLYFR